MDKLVEIVKPIEDPQEAVVALLNSVADRIEASRGNDGLLTEYVKSLRDGSDQVASAILSGLPSDQK